MKISVVICAKNEEKLIEDCLKRLTSQKIKPEIIVVDGHSTDNTVKIAKKYVDKIIFDNKKGVPVARNMGAQACSSDIIAYTDADTKPDLDWTKKILENMKDNIAISGPIKPYDGSLWVKTNVSFWAGTIFIILGKLNYPCFNGTNMAFKKDVLLKHKFNTNISILEDFEIGWRLKKYGKVSFIKNMPMNISSRRFDKGFWKVVLGDYIPHYVRILTGKHKKYDKYFERE